MSQYYLLTVNVYDRPLPWDQLKRTLDKLKDWVRVVPNTWLVYTELPLATVFERVRAIMHSDDAVFMLELNTGHRAMWIETTVVEWVKRDRRAETYSGE